MDDLRPRIWRKTDYAYAQSTYSTSLKSYVLLKARASEAVQFQWSFKASAPVRFKVEFVGSTGYAENEYDRLHGGGEGEDVLPRREYSGVVSFHCAGDVFFEWANVGVVMSSVSYTVSRMPVAGAGLAVDTGAAAGAAAVVEARGGVAPSATPVAPPPPAAAAAAAADASVLTPAQRLLARDIRALGVEQPGVAESAALRFSTVEAAMGWIFREEGESGGGESVAPTAAAAADANTRPAASPAPPGVSKVLFLASDPPPLSFP